MKRMLQRFTGTLASLALALATMPVRVNAQVSPDIVGTATPAILATTVAGFPSCIAWRPTGVCFYQHCTIVGCSIRTSIKVSHYVPDAIVSTYADPLNHPWTDVGKPFSSVLSGAGSTLIRSPLDASANTASDTKAKKIATVKAADAIGNPLANLAALASGSGEAAMPASVGIPDAQELMKFPGQELPRILSLWATVPVTLMNTMARDAMALAQNPGSLLSSITSLPGSFAGLGSMGSGSMPGGSSSSNGGGGGSGMSPGDLQSLVQSLGGGEGGDLFCPGGTQPFNVYYHSDLDSWFWRSMFPVDLLYPQSWIPGFSEVGNLVTQNTWGNIYPRTGELVQTHPAKASAALSARVHSIISQEAQAHIYKKLQTPGGFVYFARFADPKWQPVFPLPEPGCITFGDPDIVGPLAARDFKTSSTNGYIWNLWTRYECCRSRGAFLFSIP